MSRERTSHYTHASAESPSEVEITLLECEGLAHNGLARLLAARRGIALAAVAALAVAALAAAIAGRGGTPHRSAALTARHMNDHIRLRARLPGAAGVAAAYGYPARCLTVTLSRDRDFARADFNHASACGRYAGDPTAIFRRSHRVWQPVLDAVTYTCPVDLLPGVVQRQLDVCQ